MSTVTLSCTKCGKLFTKTKAEISRRRYKTDSDNWFCGLSCSASYGNANRTDPVKPPPPQLGNKYRKKYTDGYGWYIHRVLSDKRKHARLDETVTTRLRFAEHIESIFTGRCVYSGREIQLWPLAHTADPFAIASLDRIDCSKGYEIGNVHWVSRAMNLARNNTDHDTFMSQTEWLRS